LYNTSPDAINSTSSINTSKITIDSIKKPESLHGELHNYSKVCSFGVHVFMICNSYILDFISLYTNVLIVYITLLQIMTTESDKKKLAFNINIDVQSTYVVNSNT